MPRHEVGEEVVLLLRVLQLVRLAADVGDAVRKNRAFDSGLLLAVEVAVDVEQEPQKWRSLRLERSEVGVEVDGHGDPGLSRDRKPSARGLLARSRSPLDSRPLVRKSPRQRPWPLSLTQSTSTTWCGSTRRDHARSTASTCTSRKARSMDSSARTAPGSRRR